MNKITDYMLPRITELLYDKEAMSSIALSKTIADKINELVDAYNTLSAERLTKAQEQDGKINKAILYIKDNLANTLHDILSTMEYNGEIKAIVDTLLPVILEEKFTYSALPEESVAGSSKVSDVRYPYGNVMRYGAHGDGMLSDTLAFQIAANMCRKNGYAFTASADAFVIDGDIDLTGIKSVVINGAIKCKLGAKVKIGDSSSNGSGNVYSFGNVDNLHVSGLKNSCVSFNNVNDLEIFADGDDSTKSSTAYCSFYGSVAENIVINSIGSNIGWINENIFRIKRVKNITIDGNYAHNNNHFEECGLESAKVTILNGNNNHFSGRGEGGITVDDKDCGGVNFFEEEYFYRYNSGKEVSETAGGGVKFSPIHKIQSEHMVMELNGYSKEFPVNALTISNVNKIVPANWGEVFDSGIVPINGTIVIKANSSDKCLRSRINFYDEFGNVIHDYKDVGFVDSIMNPSSGDWSYAVSTNVNSDTCIIYGNGKAKYFRYQVIFGGGVSTLRPEYIRVKYIKYVNTDFNFGNTLPYNTVSKKPTTGYWRVGDRLYFNNPDTHGYVGCVCTSYGTPGTWKYFGKIE